MEVSLRARRNSDKGVRVIVGKESFLFKRGIKEGKESQTCVNVGVEKF